MSVSRNDQLIWVLSGPLLVVYFSLRLKDTYHCLNTIGKSYNLILAQSLNSLSMFWTILHILSFCSLITRYGTLPTQTVLCSICFVRITWKSPADMPWHFAISCIVYHSSTANIYSQRSCFSCWLLSLVSLWICCLQCQFSHLYSASIVCKVYYRT